MSDHRYVTFAALKASMADRLCGPETDAEAIAWAAHEAHSIAQNAALAERLLYFIHRSGAFAPPVAGVPATIWSVLVRARLDELITREPIPELDAEQMVAALERGVQSDGTHRHALLDDLAADRSLRGYKVFLKNWYAMASGLTEFLFAVSQRANSAMRREIEDNLSDEIFDGTPHIDLRARVLEGAGTRFDELGAIDDPDLATETFALINWRAAASALVNPCVALGLFYSIEANWQYESRRHYAALKKLGIADEYLTSLALHVERDEDHASEWLAMVRRAVDSPRDRGLVVRGLTAEFVVRRKMYDAIRRSLYGR